MMKNIQKYFDDLKGMFGNIIATDINGKVCRFDEAVSMSVHAIIEKASSGGKIIFIGNGASASIASHIATDFWKNADIRAMAFNDASALTCISNDFGYEHVFEKPIEMFSDPDDILVSISSSGRSENIIRAVKAAITNKLKIITLSGFKQDNPLRQMGSFNFYVPSDSYGHVEITHHSICHCLIDMIIKEKNG